MNTHAAGSSRGWLRVALWGSIAIVCFDVVAALASRGFAFRYANASFGSWIIYLIIGYIAARASGHILPALSAAAMIGLVEATLGWWLSSLIVPLQVPLDAFSPTAVVVTVLIVSVTAGIVGLSGGLVRKWWERSHSIPHSAE